MGCVSSRQPIYQDRPERQTQKADTNIVHDEYSLQPLPDFLVLDKACGYCFTGEGLQTTVPTLYTEQGGKEDDLFAYDELQGLVEQCEYFYREHNIDGAHESLQKLARFVEVNRSHPGFTKSVQQSLSRKQDLFNQIRQEYKDVKQYQQQILKDGWILKTEKKGVRISTRREDPTVGVLVQAIVDQPFQKLITVLIEMDLYKQFMPFMAVSRQQKICARNCRIGYTQNHFPILSIRQAFFQGVGYDRLKTNNTLFLFTRSIQNRPELQQKLGYKCVVNPDNVQLEYKYFVLLYEPICTGKGKITMAINVDTKMAFIPMWLQDKITEDFGNEFLENLVKVSKKFEGSQWQRNTEQNPDIFLFFKNAIEEHLRSKPQFESKETNDRSNQ